MSAWLQVAAALARNIGDALVQTAVEIDDIELNNFTRGSSTYPEAEEELERPEDAGEVIYDVLCPECGDADMVKRYRRKDNKPFAGCSSYPHCTGIIPWTKSMRLDKDVLPHERQGSMLDDDEIPF